MQLITEEQDPLIVMDDTFMNDLHENVGKVSFLYKPIQEKEKRKKKMKMRILLKFNHQET